MARRSEAFLQKRVSVGAALASLATLLVCLILRIAAVFDAGLGATGWLWPGFEAALLLFVLPLVAVLFCALEIEQGGVLNSAMAGIAAMVVSGMAIGFAGHAGWFPAPSITE